MSSPYNMRASLSYRQSVLAPSTVVPDPSSASFSTLLTQLPDPIHYDHADLEALQILREHVGLTQSQLDLLTNPVVAVAMYRFIHRVFNSSFDGALRQVGEHDTGLSQSGQQLPSNNTLSFAGPAEPESTEPLTSISSGETLTYSAYQQPELSENTSSTQHGMNMGPIYVAVNAPPCGDAPSLLENHRPTSTQSVHSRDDDKRSNFPVSEDTVSVNDAASHIYDEHHHAPGDSRRLSVSASRRASTSNQSGSGWHIITSGNFPIQNQGLKTPCPKCKCGFESPSEFAKHMIAEHERPVEFICMHYLPGRNGAQYFCQVTKWHISSFTKHHTEQHSAICQRQQTQHTLSPECRHEVVRNLSYRQRGCWLCNRLTFTLEEWVAHHIGVHRGCRRSAMSQTWAMKSLLSHPDLTLHWQFQIKYLEVSTGFFWDLTWPKGPKDADMEGLIKSLETGFFEGKDFHKDISVRARVAEIAMRATEDTRRKLEAIQPQQLDYLAKELDRLHLQLADADTHAEDLSRRARTLALAASAAPSSFCMTDDQVGPWLSTQWDGASFHSSHPGLDLDELSSMQLDFGEEMSHNLGSFGEAIDWE